MTDSSQAQYLYVAADRLHAGTFDDTALDETTERHALPLPRPPLQRADPRVRLSDSTTRGAVFELETGLPTDADLELADRTLSSGKRVWLYWPAEEAVECVDAERLNSLRRHVARVRWLRRVGMRIDTARTRWERMPTALRWVYRGEFPVRRSDIEIKLTLAVLRAQPLRLDDVSGPGVYLRCDYWRDGAADFRQRNVAASLAQASERLISMTASPEPSLDSLGVRQVVMDRPRRDADEDAIVLAPTHYLPIVKAACQAAAPAYLYERLTAGQSTGAEVSQALGVPFVAEYPGRDALMRDALGDKPPFYPELYSRAEELALRQASVVVVESAEVRDDLVTRGIDAARIVVAPDGANVACEIDAALAAFRNNAARAARLDTGDAYKDQVQNQWDQNPVGAQHARESQPHTVEWFLEVERHRYGVYAPWMPDVMEFTQHRREDVLEIGGGIGTDLAQFAANGARVTDVDLAAGHLRLAEENFRLRGLQGRFVHHDAETLPFDDASFDVVYSNGVLHHTPNTRRVVAEIRRVLRPAGRAIVMLYAENSLHYWRKLVWLFGVRDGLLDRWSMGEIMSRSVERTANDARPLVKVYTPRRARALFDGFARVDILQRQLLPEELPAWLRPALPYAEQRMGWNLIIKASKAL